MIPFASCMCFQGKGALWTSTPGKRQTSTEVVVTADHKICIRVTEKPQELDATAKKRPANLSKSEWCLLRALEHSPYPWRPPTTFQTPQRRRCRARIPIIRSQALRSALLDDAYQGITQGLLEGCGRWPFNTFHLDVSTGGRSLSILMVHLFQQYGFLQHFALDPIKVWRCFNLFESCYHASNPYHNSVHAADVTQAMHCFLQEKKISSCITPVEAVSALLAAVTHDLDHPGVNQPFLIATSNHLATLYKNFSVLENHHWRMAISCLREARLFDHLDKATWDEIENNIHSLILATDITRQQEFLAKFKRYLENDALDLREPQHRHFILQIALKCADLCNPCRPWPISQNWSQQVCLEFYKQGEFEKSLNLPVTPICDRTRSTIAKIQSDFFRFVVTPLFEVWHGFLSSELSVQLITNLHSNQQCWERKAIKASEASSAKKRSSAAVTPVEQETSPVDADEESDDCPLQQRENLPATLPSLSDEDILSSSPWCQRRCSMPLSVPKMLPRTTLRRQSFPHTSYATSLISDTYHIHRSPHVSLRTLSAEQLQPKTSIVSLSSSGALSLLGLISMETHPSKRLVHQPSSFPPFSYTRSIIEPPDLEELGSEDCSEAGSCDKDSDCCTVDSSVGAMDGQSTVSNAQSADTQGQSIVSPLNEELLESANRDLGSTNAESPVAGDSVPSQNSAKLCDASVEDTVVEGCPRECLPNVSSECSPRTFPGGEISGQRTGHYPLQPGRKGGSGWQEPPWRLPFAEEEGPCKEFPLTQPMTTWCSQVSRSLSEERPEPPSRGFDSPAPSWKSSASSVSSCHGSGPGRLMQRRGSAPVTTTSGVTPCALLGGNLESPGSGDLFPFNYGRRWSLAADSMPISAHPDCRDIEVKSSHHPLCRELVRRHSFGILEPFAGVPSSESENDGSSTEPTSTGTTCSTRRSSTVVIHNTRVRHTEIYDPASDAEAGSCSSESHDMFPTCLQPPRHVLGRRRGSLPADIPISLVTRISSYTTSVMPIPGSTDSIAKADIMSSAPWRRSSTGEILGALIGQSSSMFAQSARQLAPPSTSCFSGIRRGSGGLELEGGFWHSSAGVFSPWQNVCGVSKTARTLCTTDSAASEDFCLVRRHLVGLSSGISGVSSQRLWRGSMPFDLSLLSSASSGNLASGGLED